MTSKGSPKLIFVETNVPKAKVECGERKRKRRKPKWELNRVFQERWCCEILLGKTGLWEGWEDADGEM